MQRVGRYHVFEEIRRTEGARVHRAYDVAGGVLRPVELVRGLGVPDYLGGGPRALLRTGLLARFAAPLSCST